MKKLALSLGIVLCPVLASAAQYVGIGLGTDYGIRTDVNNRGQKVGLLCHAHYGYDLGNNFAVEGEIAYRERHKRTKYDMAGEDEIAAKHYESSRSMAYMANLKYNLSQIAWQNITPYIGAGVGYVQNTKHDKVKRDQVSTSDKIHDNGFGWQLLGGVKYPVAENIDLAAQYSYHIGQAHVKAHDVSLSLVKGF